jgi:hypothetical protein
MRDVVPSTMVASGTPASTASRHASIFGIIPEASVGRIARNSLVVMEAMISWVSGQLLYRPSTSVKTSSRSASRAAASAAAAVSAFTFSTARARPGRRWPPRGCGRPRSGRATASVLTSTTSPTRPRSTSCPSTTVPRRCAVNSPASSPDMPTASGPWTLSSPTSSRPTWPTSTIRTTSIASGVVTRRPPWNSEGMPSRRSIALICGPPPCTTTGRTPHWRRKTTSSTKACLSSSLVIALPPYLMTIVFPAYFSSHGSASMRVPALV